MSRPLVTLVLPVYNEADIFVESTQVLVDYMRSLEPRYDWEMVVVDDGSSDLTPELARTLADSEPRVRLLQHPVNLRLGNAMRTAIGASRGDYVVTFDCDLSYSPDHIGRLLATIEQQRAKVVIASPYMRGGRTVAIPFGRKVLSRYANRFLSLTAQGTLSTLTGLVRAYDGPFLRTLNLKAEDTDVNVEIIYKTQILRGLVVEIPATLDWTFLVSRRGGPLLSSRLVWTTAKSLVVGFLFRPFMFFMVPGLLLTLLGFAGFGWLVVDGLVGSGAAGSRTDGMAAPLYDHPLAFGLASLALIVGIQLVSIAMITLQAKRYFEEMFHISTTVLKRQRAGQEPRLRAWSGED